MEDDLVAKKFLELAEETSCEARLLFQLVDVELPLVLEERF